MDRPGLILGYLSARVLRVISFVGLLIVLSGCGVFVFDNAITDRAEQRRQRFSATLFASRPQAPVYPETATMNASVSFTLPNPNMIYQVTPEIIGRLGDFFTPSATALPRPLEFTSVAIMVVPKELRADWMQAIDQSLFILDGKQGVLYFSFGKNSLYSFADNELLGVKSIAVDNNGLIGLLNADNTVSLCLQFNGAVISKRPDCVPLAQIQATHLTGAGKGEFIALSATGEILLLKDDKTFTTIDVPGLLVEQARSVWADSSMLIVTDHSGERVTIFDREKHSVIHQKSIFDLDFGEETLPVIGLVAVVPISGGGYIGVSSLHNVLIFFDNNLSVQASRQFPEFPYPLEYMHSPSNLFTNLEGGIIVLSSKNAITAYAVRETADYDFGYIIPTQLQGLFTTSNLDAIIEELKVNPQADILDMPEIKAFINAAREEL